MQDNARQTDTTSAFWVLLAPTTTVYIAMYILIYGALICLRYILPDVPVHLKYQVENQGYG